MQDPSIHAQLAESKAEIARLIERLSIGAPTVHKDLSLVSLIPRWSGEESGTPLEEFIESIDSAAQLGRWTSSDCARVLVLKLTEPARLFYNICSILHRRRVLGSV
jgi:hypothetical protein